MSQNNNREAMFEVLVLAHQRFKPIPKGALQLTFSGGQYAIKQLTGRFQIVNRPQTMLPGGALIDSFHALENPAVLESAPTLDELRSRLLGRKIVP